MRLFYENWSFLEDQKSSDITGELLVSNANSSDASDELTAIIPIADFKLSGINLADFPVEDIFKVPFSHHITIFSKVKNLQERYYYIHRVVEENLQVDTPVFMMTLAGCSGKNKTADKSLGKQTVWLANPIH